VLTLLAPFAIGMRFPSGSWAAGPPAAILATVLAILIAPESGPARHTAMGNMTQKDQFVFMLEWGGFLVLPLVAFIYALIASAGLYVGQRGEARRSQATGPGGGDLDRDDDAPSL
jgi:hypothetical protein